MEIFITTAFHNPIYAAALKVTLYRLLYLMGFISAVMGLNNCVPTILMFFSFKLPLCCFTFNFEGVSAAEAALLGQELSICGIFSSYSGGEAGHMCIARRERQNPSANGSAHCPHMFATRSVFLSFQFVFLSLCFFCLFAFLYCCLFAFFPFFLFFIFLFVVLYFSFFSFFLFVNKVLIFQTLFTKFPESCFMIVKALLQLNIEC